MDTATETVNDKRREWARMLVLTNTEILEACEERLREIKRIQDSWGAVLPWNSWKIWKLLRENERALADVATRIEVAHALYRRAVSSPEDPGSPAGPPTA